MSRSKRVWGFECHYSLDYLQPQAFVYHVSKMKIILLLSTSEFINFLFFQMTFDPTAGHQGTSMSPSPSPGTGTTLVTVDIVVLVAYFLLVLAVGFWVSTREKKRVTALMLIPKPLYIVSNVVFDILKTSFFKKKEILLVVLAWNQNVLYRFLQPNTDSKSLSIIAIKQMLPTSFNKDRTGLYL